MSLALPGLEVQQAASAGDLSLASYVFSLFQTARQHRRPLVNLWQQCYLALHCKNFWNGRTQGYPTPTLPEMWPIVAAQVGWMTDTRPGFEVAPIMEAGTPGNIKPLYDSMAQDLQTVLHANWIVNDTDAELETMLWDAHSYGTGFLKSMWDANLVGGLGDARLIRVDPWTLYPDPNATRLDNMNFIIEVRQMTLQEIDRTFPGKLAKVLTSATDQQETAPTRLDSSAFSGPILNYGPVPPATDTKYGFTNDRARARSPYDKVTVLECWIRQHERIEHVHADGTKTHVTFDGWRCIVATSNAILLDKYATEMYPHAQHPYSRFVLQETGEFWGQSLVELLMPIQSSINWISAAMEHHLYLTGNPIMLHDERSGLKSKALTNAPGQRVTVNDGGQVQWLTPPPMDAQLAGQLIQFYKSEMEGIPGLSAMVRGFMPSGRNAQGVLEQVQESAFVRVRLALRNLERTLRHAGEKMSSIIVQFYDEPRAVALVGPNGEKSFQALKAKHFYLPDVDGSTPLRYQLLTGAGSMLPTSRQARSTLMMQLFNSGVVDEEAVLEALQVPNWRNIVARVREMKAAAGTLGQPPGSRARGAN